MAKGHGHIGASTGDKHTSNTAQMGTEGPGLIRIGAPGQAWGASARRGWSELQGLVSALGALRTASQAVPTTA